MRLPDESCIKSPRFHEFVLLFNRREFFAAHEVLEGMWLEKSGIEKDFLQGLIQIAASLVHVQRENPPGAARVADNAMAYLAGFPDHVHGFPLGRLKIDLMHCLEHKNGFPEIIFPSPD